jgi:hypothetical protein
MSKRTDKWINRFWGASSAKELGFDRTLRGLREGESRDLYFGLALSALSYLQNTKPRKQLIHRQTVPEGTAIVIHNKKSGNPRLEIVKPPKKARKARKNRSG